MTEIPRYCNRCRKARETGRVKLVALIESVPGWPTADQATPL
jgi:hypothetical protein